MFRRYLLLAIYECLIFAFLTQKIEGVPQEPKKLNLKLRNLNSDFDNSIIPPSIEIYELRSVRGQSKWKETLLAKVNTDGNRTLITEPDVQGIKLYCEADYPIHWTYEGIADFSFLSTSSGSYSKSGPDGTINEFYETVYLDPLSGAHTAQYVCYGQNSHEKRSSAFIYVPGNNLFVSTRGRNIYFTGDQGRVEEITIPCAVSHPDVKVTLSKASDEDVSEIVNVNNKAVFDPKHGFHIKINDFSQPSGKYICTARHNNLFKIVQHNVIRDHGSLKRCARSCPENSHCERGRRGFEPEFCKCDRSFKALDSRYFMCLRSCKTDADCSSTMSCQPRETPSTTQSYFWTSIATSFEKRDYAFVCKNPCLYSLENIDGKSVCDRRSSCTVNNHIATCNRI